MKTHMMHKKSFLNIKLVWSVMLLSVLSTQSFAKSTADDILGKWRAQSVINGEEVSIMEVKKYKKTNTYYATVISQNKKHTHHRETCHEKCPSKFKNKKILGMVILWNLKAKDPNKAIYTGGYGIDPWRGKMFQGSGKLIGSTKNILKLRGSLIESKWIGQDFSFTRVQ